MSSVIRLRPFLNSDPPALAALWNRALPLAGVARPVNEHDLDLLLFDKPHFDRKGLIVAESEDKKLVGFVHAGFGPADPDGPSQQLDTSMGTIALLVVDKEWQTSDLGKDLLTAGEAYLTQRGAKVIYAGGQYPLNPFYWGLYGGSEWAGILQSDSAFHNVVLVSDYRPTSTTILLEADVSGPEPRDRLAPIIKRQARVDIMDEPLLCWWDAAALGFFHPVALTLRSKTDSTLLAHALVWTMTGFTEPDGCRRLGLAKLEVPLDQRHKGYGRFMVGEVIRYARSESFQAVCVQTNVMNEIALKLYEAMSFVRVQTSILYRRQATTS